MKMNLANLRTSILHRLGLFTNSEFQLALDKLRDEQRIRINRSLHFARIAARYFSLGERSPEVSVRLCEAGADSDPSWIDKRLSENIIHEKEYLIFGKLKSRGTILDVGANWGYSVTSMWAAGCVAPILSFEPNRQHHRCLQRLKETRPGLMDWSPFALGSEKSELRFTIPVIGGDVCSALASAQLKDNITWAILANYPDYCDQYFPGVEEPRLQFADEVWEADTLDNVLATGTFSVPTNYVSAIKIDVEGHEPEMLAGAIKTLETHKPLIMIEGANRNPRVAEIMKRTGFLFANYDDGSVVLSDTKSSSLDGFFVHETRVEEYQSYGLLTQASLKSI